MINTKILFSAGTPTAAGYLTQGPTSKLNEAPPPVDKEENMVRPDVL